MPDSQQTPRARHTVLDDAFFLESDRPMTEAEMIRQLMENMSKPKEGPGKQHTAPLFGQDTNLPSNDKPLDLDRFQRIEDTPTPNPYIGGSMNQDDSPFLGHDSAFGYTGGSFGYTPPAPPKPKGSLTVTIFGQSIVVVGGPYRAKPDDLFGIKMAKEINLPCDINIPTPDFQVPDRALVEDAALEVLSEGFLPKGRRYYVGCMAGQGRTGLFLASLAFLAGDDNPVKTVRAQYYPHAVETAEQERFVTGFDRAAFRKQLIRCMVYDGTMTRDLRAYLTWGEWAYAWKTRFFG